MSKIVVTNSLTLDGVMQAPGRADEDQRDGFPYGGWAAPYSDPSMVAVMAEGSANTGAMLFGRRTYEDFAAVWPNAPEDNPFAAVLNNRQKYVASTTLREPLAWRNSTLLTGDAADAVARLREQPGKDIVILGSGDLIQSLMRRNLIDAYVLLIHPLILGTGHRLFPQGVPLTRLQLVGTRTTSTGVIIATYEPGESPADTPA